MFVLPSNILLLELLRFCWRWSWLGYLRDQVCCRSFCDAVDEDTEKWNLQKDEEGECEAVENTLAIVEPLAFLLGGVSDAGEVGLELYNTY